jgi:hypothetical protein
LPACGKLVVEPAAEIVRSGRGPPIEKRLSPLVDRLIFGGDQRSKQVGDISVFDPIEPASV